MDAKNRIRRLLRHYFVERDCVKMVRPVELERDLQNLQTLPDKMLRRQFVDDMKIARNKIIKKAGPKKVNGKDITGEILYHLSKAYTEAINNGQTPNIESAWNYVIKEKIEVEAANALGDIEGIFDSEEIKQMQQ